MIGSPNISSDYAKFNNAIQINLGDYLSLNRSFTLGGRDFTIDGYAKLDTRYTDKQIIAGRIFNLWTSWNSASGFLGLQVRSHKIVRLHINTNGYDISNNNDNLFHYAIVYQHDKRNLSLYLDGILKGSYSVVLNAYTYPKFTLGGKTYNTNNGDQPFAGTFDEFRVVDGVAVWKENFTPPMEFYEVD